ncbi:hypothetical protein LMH87_000452 [Akanthomyces muscarius]|uniref:Uncharacterized protein n=1 Tax=Akanthomyces muscarius TaxID=2231603 RepID=A0A9W8UNU1_AKAMU|nr:hypothetical protein LMH87_000452 [Akanthomyces muscarius]KAJ4155196.1 hypothetical protein LMH87_000452 [Akanthomyces muscarius]
MDPMNAQGLDVHILPCPQPADAFTPHHGCLNLAFRIAVIDPPKCLKTRHQSRPVLSRHIQAGIGNITSIHRHAQAILKHTY